MPLRTSFEAKYTNKSIKTITWFSQAYARSPKLNLLHHFRNGVLYKNIIKKKTRISIKFTKERAVPKRLALSFNIFDKNKESYLKKGNEWKRMEFERELSPNPGDQI